MNRLPRHFSQHHRDAGCVISEMLDRRAGSFFQASSAVGGRAALFLWKGPSRNGATKMEYRQKGICDSIS